MAALTLPEVRPDQPVDDDDGVKHLSCCDEDVALCGLDISDYEFNDDDDVPICPLCAYVDDEGLPCPVPGCPHNGWGLRRLARWFRR